MDLASAVYTGKDGVKREVNLVPNEKVADELFDKLTEKRVALFGKRQRLGVVSTHVLVGKKFLRFCLYNLLKTD